MYLQSEKFRCASKVTTKLASLASEATGCNFDSKMAQLEQVATAWENDKKISIFCGKQTNNFSMHTMIMLSTKGYTDYVVPIVYLHTDYCSSDDSDVHDGEPQSELMHLLSDRQRESKLDM